MNLAPGPELDKLIQEYVLKLVLCDGYCSGISPMELAKTCDHPEGTCTPSWVMWGYSTEPGWNIVVQKWLLEQLDSESGLGLFYDGPSKALPWFGYVRMGHPGRPRVSFDMTAVTLEHLFCLLALKLAKAPVDLSEYEEEIPNEG